LSPAVNGDEANVAITERYGTRVPNL